MRHRADNKPLGAASVSLPALLCGIDAGTSQVRALVFRPDGAVVASAAQPTPDARARPRQRRAGCRGSLVRRPRCAAPGRGARFRTPRRSAASPSPASARPGCCSAADGRSARADHRLVRHPHHAASSTGSWSMSASRRCTASPGLCADPTFSLLKLLWYQAPSAGAVRRARACWLNVGDYLAWRLCGERATDVSLASRTHAARSRAPAAGPAPLLEMCELPATLLPPLRPSGTPIGTIRPEIAAATGLPPDCVVGVGGHDHVCGMIAAGADAPGVLLDSLGTAEALTLVRDRPIDDPALGRDGFNQGAFDAGRPLYYVFGGLPTAAARSSGSAASIGSRPRHADRGGRGSTARRQRPVPAASAAGLAALPRPGRARCLPGHLLRRPAAATLFRAVLEGIALDGGNMLDSMLRHLAVRRPAEFWRSAGAPESSPDASQGCGLRRAAVGAGPAGHDLPWGSAARRHRGRPVCRPHPGAQRAQRAGAERRARCPHGTRAIAQRRLATYAAAYTALRPLHARLLDD